MADRSRVLEALVQRTVRDVLFPDLPAIHEGSSPNRPRSRVLWESSSVPRQEEDSTSRPDTESQHKRVLSYASWSDAQLKEERRRLTRILRASELKRVESPEQEEESGLGEATAMEAWALLELFLSERKLACGELDSTKTNWRLLHAQLGLYADYFEASHQRKILHELDVAPIERMHQLFLQHHPNQ